MSLGGSIRIAYDPTTRTAATTRSIGTEAQSYDENGNPSVVIQRYGGRTVTTTTKVMRYNHVEIKRGGSQPSGKGQADYFTGAVRFDPLFQAPAPARVVGLNVTFEPGARTAWHTHPLGQTLVITTGLGLAQRWGGPIEEIRPGDSVWFSPGEKHWHGASPSVAMSHIAIQEQLDGKTVEWMEHVSDDQYLGR